MTTAETPPQTLPEVAQLAMDNSHNIATLIEKFEELTATSLQVASEMAGQLTAAHERLVQTVASLVQEDRSQVAALTEGLAELRGQVSSLTVNVARLAEAQQQTNDRVTEMNDHMTRLSGRVANLTGGRYEKEAGRLAQRRIRRLLNLPDAIVTHSSWSPGDVVADAVSSDDVTDAEATELNRADLVITGQNASGDTIHALAEISVTIQPYDVTRSSARAAILNKALRQTVHAVVVGGSSTPEAVAMAENGNVIIVTIPAPEDEN